MIDSVSSETNHRLIDFQVIIPRLHPKPVRDEPVDTGRVLLIEGPSIHGR